jgi:hypothetical protein
VREAIIPLDVLDDPDLFTEVAAMLTEQMPTTEEGIREVTAKHVPKDMERLNAAMRAAPYIEDWVLAVRAEVERRLLAGEELPDFGLDTGRKGAQAFSDQETATHLLRKKFRLKEKDVFNFKLKTPTQLKELTKPFTDPDTGEVIEPLMGPKRWGQLMDLVSQRDPKPTVKRKDLIKKPYSPPAPAALSALPDEDDTDLY